MNPFKNVIRTEPPPDLHSLIEDKEKLLQNRVKESITRHASFFDVNLDDSDFEKDIISITTDASYRRSPEYTAEHIDFSSTKPQTAQSSTVANKSVVKKPANNSSTQSFDQTDDFLESVFGALFRGGQSDDSITDDIATEAPIQKKTIPPFKNITNSLSLMDILNATRKSGNRHGSSSDIPQRINNKIFDPTTELSASGTDPPTTVAPKVENLNILRDVLLATLNSPPSIAKNSYNTQQNGKIDIPPFLPFLSPIFPGTPTQDIDAKHSFSYAPIRSDLDLIIPELNSKRYGNTADNDNYSPDSYQVFPEYSSISNTKSYVVNPVNVEQLNRHRVDATVDDDGAAAASSSSSSGKTSAGTKNSIGVLKLAGCNIYGRMYRVGRIISELSGPCLECKCTEVGVHCTPLHC